MAIASPKRKYQTKSQGPYVCNPRICVDHPAQPGRHCGCGIPLADLDGSPCFWCQLEGADVVTQAMIKQVLSWLAQDHPAAARKRSGTGAQMAGERG